MILDKMQRVNHIHEAIAAGRYPSIADLAHECEVDERTVKRDIAYLRNVRNAPIKTSRQNGRQGYYYAGDYSPYPVSLDQQELLALCLTYHVADTMQDTSYFPPLKRALEKILVQHGMMETLRQMECVSFMPGLFPGNEVLASVHFRQLLHAICTHHQVKMHYFAASRNRKEWRTVDPLWIYLHDGVWYLLAFCHTRKALRNFAINRIRALESLSTTFLPRSRTEIDDCLHSQFAAGGDGMIEVCIEFDACVAERVRERYWTPDQRMDPSQPDDGPCILTMSVSSLKLLLHQLLPFGKHARPISPPELLRMMQAEVEGMERRLRE